MTFKSLRIPTLGLAGTRDVGPAGPAVADNLTLQTFIRSGGTAIFQPGGAFSSFDISFADPVTGNIFVHRPVQCPCNLGIQPENVLAGRKGLPGRREQ